MRDSLLERIRFFIVVTLAIFAAWVAEKWDDLTYYHRKHNWLDDVSHKEEDK